MEFLSLPCMNHITHVSSIIEVSVLLKYIAHMKWLKNKFSLTFYKLSNTLYLTWSHLIWNQISERTHFPHFFFKWDWYLNSGLQLAKQVLYSMRHTYSPFSSDSLEIGSYNLFAWASFEPQFSRSQPPKQLGLQAWATSTGHHFPHFSKEHST
jgi:hypothetical protein